MSAPTTPQKRKPSPGGDQATNPSPSKKPAIASGAASGSNLPIKSWITPTDATPSQPNMVDALTGDQLKLHGLLVVYLASLDTQAKVMSTRAWNAKEKVRTVAAMATLYMPMSEARWAAWREELAEDEAPQGLAYRYTHSMHEFGQKLASTWKQDRLPDREKSGVKGRPAVTTDTQKKLHEWTRSICYLTSSNWGSQSAHIYPVAVAKHPNSPFLMALAMFWSPKDLTTLRELLAQPGIEERNLLMLSGDVHTAWSRGRVAFKVLASLDPQQIDLEVHLLSNLSPGQVDHSHGRDPGDAEYTSDLRHSRTGNIIKTGDVIHIRTDDINKYPLPSTPLLELQYHCQRVVRASAAADFLCVIFHDDATGPSAAAQAASDKGQEEGHTDSHAADTEPLDQAFCDMLIEEAVQHQIIAVEAVGHWRHILYQDGLEEEQLDDSQQHVRRPIPSRSSNTGSPKKWTEPEA